MYHISHHEIPKGSRTHVAGNKYWQVSLSDTRKSTSLFLYFNFSIHVCSFFKIYIISGNKCAAGWVAHSGWGSQKVERNRLTCCLFWSFQGIDSKGGIWKNIISTLLCYVRGSLNKNIAMPKSFFPWWVTKWQTFLAMSLRHQEKGKTIYFSVSFSSLLIH